MVRVPLRSRSLAVFAALALCSVAGAQAPARADLDQLAMDDVVAKSMAFWQVPGLALAVVSEGMVVLSRTYGRRDAERDLPVTPETLFALGSLAKSLTATTLGRLIDEGRMTWDGRVIEYLPEFRLAEDKGTAALTIRHLMTHTAGLPRHDALWYLDAYARPELVERIRHLAPFGPPGADFAYNNLMVAVAGTAAERVGGAPWADFVATHVLAPLGMTSTRVRLADFLAASDRALGYFPTPTRRVPQPVRDTDPVAPAAGFYASIQDAARYLAFHAEGARALLRPETAAALTTPSFVFREHRANFESAFTGDPEISFEAYAMGFYVLDYRGVRTVRHTGVIDGYAAVLSFIPARRAGVVVLTNLSGDNPVPTIVERAVYDRLLGLEPLPWLERFAPSTAARREAGPPPPETDAPPPTAGRPLPDYAGIYRHPAYGDIVIAPAANGRSLTGRLHKLQFALRVRGKDVFVVPDTVWPLRQGLRVRFHADESGAIVRLTAPLADGPTYRRQAGPLAFERVRE